MTEKEKTNGSVGVAEGKNVEFKKSLVYKAETSQPDSDQPAAIYNMGGVRMQHMQRGLNIVRTPDGKVRKYIKR